MLWISLDGQSGNIGSSNSIHSFCERLLADDPMNLVFSNFITIFMIIFIKFMNFMTFYLFMY